MTPQDYFDNFDDLPLIIGHGEVMLPSGNRFRYVFPLKSDLPAGMGGVLIEWWDHPTQADKSEAMEKLTGATQDELKENHVEIVPVQRDQEVATVRPPDDIHGGGFVMQRPKGVQ